MLPRPRIDLFTSVARPRTSPVGEVKTPNIASEAVMVVVVVVVWLTVVVVVEDTVCETVVVKLCVVVSL